MKKVISLFLMLMFVGGVLHSQTNYFPSSGYVSIGAGTSPTALLHLQWKTGAYPKIRIEHEPSPLVPSNTWDIANTSGTGFHIDYGTGSNPTMTTFFLINQSGNIGIGTSNPTAKLEVVGQVKITGGNPGQGKILISDQNGLASWGTVPSGGDSDWLESDDDIIRQDGNVIIGRNVNTPTGYRLYVAEGILTEQIKVAGLNSSEWSDFVFAKDYNLISLNELETFIAKNHQLPKIPSAVDVEKNGINLGQMDALLLQKIEELTLYIIDQEKRIKELEQINKNMSSQISN